MENSQLIPADHQLLWNERKQKYEVIDLSTGKMVPTTQDIARSFAPESMEYTSHMADMVLSAIREGKSLEQIKVDNKFPPLNAIQMWKALNPDFKRRMEQAYKDRAEHYHDKAIELALAAPALHKDFVPGQKLAITTLQWAAERGDAKRYSGKSEESGSKGGVTIIIDTGVQDKGVTNINIDVDENGEFKGFIDEQAHSTVRGTGATGTRRSGQTDPTEAEFTEITQRAEDRFTEIAGVTTGDRTSRAVRSGNTDCEDESPPPIPQEEVIY